MRECDLPQLGSIFMTGRRRLTFCIAGVLGAVLAAGCSSTVGNVDKAGGRAGPEPIVLRAVQPVGGDPNGQIFANRVAEVSGHRLTVSVHDGWHATDWSTAETDAIVAVRSGAADIGIVPVRAWRAQGITAFDALVAPMEIGNRALEHAVLRSPIASDMVRDMSAAGVTPLGLLPGPISHFWGISGRLASPADLRGARIGTPPSVVSDRSLEALGAIPTPTYFNGADVSGFDGIVTSIGTVHGNEYEAVVSTGATDLALWPRSALVFVNTSALDALPSGSAQQLVAAARQALDPTIEAQDQSEEHDLASLCADGRTRLIPTSSTDLASFRDAFAPVYSWLTTDATTREFLRRIDRLKSTMADEPPEAPSCGSSTPPVRPAPWTAALPTQTALDGVWETVTTRAEQSAFSGTDPDLIEECNFGTIRWTLAHGVYDEVQSAGSTQTWATGTYSVDGNRLTLDITDGGGSGPGGRCHLHSGDEFTWQWSRYHDQLTIVWPDPTASPLEYPANYAVKPWHLIGDSPATVITTH